MREPLGPEGLDERTRNILMAVIHSFIHTGEPVGSRTRCQDIASEFVEQPQRQAADADGAR